MRPLRAVVSDSGAEVGVTELPILYPADGQGLKLASMTPNARVAFTVYHHAIHGTPGDFDALPAHEQAAWERVRATCATYWYA